MSPWYPLHLELVTLTSVIIGRLKTILKLGYTIRPVKFFCRL
jgi:hypothetical protein